MNRCPHYFGRHEEGCLRPIHHEGQHEFAIVLRQRIQELEAALREIAEHGDAYAKLEARKALGLTVETGAKE